MLGSPKGANPLRNCRANGRGARALCASSSWPRGRGFEPGPASEGQRSGTARIEDAEAGVRSVFFARPEEPSQSGGRRFGRQLEAVPRAGDRSIE